MNITVKAFGKTKSGKQAQLYIIEDGCGLSAALTDYGATVVSLCFKDKNGRTRDLVRGYDDVSGFEESGSFFGACVGRCANRIKGAEFSIGDKTYKLVKNDGENNLHSGPDYYNKRFWETAETGNNFVTFRLVSPDLDQGFPGNMEARVTYRTVNNRFEISYEAVSDKDTVINFTNHSFFNLNGHDAGTIFSHVVTLKANEYTESTPDLIPTGKLLPAEGTCYDFTKGRRLGDALENGTIGLYDNNFCLTTGEDGLAGSVFAPESGICMQIYTDLPGMQIYTPPMNQGKGKGGADYEAYGAVCFESQYYPDAVHQPDFAGPVFKAGEVYSTKTVYSFSNK